MVQLIAGPYLSLLVPCLSVPRQFAEGCTAPATGLSYCQPQNKYHVFVQSNVNILAREERWFERVAKEAIFVIIEQTSIKRGGGRSQNLFFLQR